MQIIKKLLSLFLVLIFILSATICTTSCGSSYEDEFLGTWNAYGGDKLVGMYRFEKDSDGNYSAKFVMGDLDYLSVYTFVEYSATKKKITFRQENGKISTHEYSFKNGYLDFDGVIKLIKQ